MDFLSASGMRLPLICLALAALTACDSTLTAPEADLAGLPDGLEVEFVIDPGTVGQGGAFDVTLRVHNTTANTIRVTTAHGCLATPHVMRDGHRVPFAGSWYACTAAITTHVFPPGETWTRQWEMRAELYAEHPGDVDGRSAPKGWYAVRAQFDMLMPDGRRPSITRVLIVE